MQKISDCEHSANDRESFVPHTHRYKKKTDDKLRNNKNYIDNTN